MINLHVNLQLNEDKDIEQAKHAFELAPQDKCIVRIDGFVRGVGSNSCGPDARAEFKHTSNQDVEYSFRISPILAKK